MTDNKKFAYFLPNTFTALNMACGFTAILLSMKGEYYKACMLIILAAIFDSVDGRIARLTGTQSTFGEEFDSLSDAISFGAAPSMIFFNRFLYNSGRAGIIVAFLYLLCAALRLARFNANIDKVSSNNFQGMPSPGAALAIIGYILFSLEFEVNFMLHPIVAGAYCFFYSFLMISNIPFTSFKNSPWIKNHKKQTLFFIFLLISSMFLYEEVMVLFWITFYVVGALIYFVINRKEYHGAVDWKDEASSFEI